MKKKWYERKTLWAAAAALVTVAADLMGLPSELTQKLLIVEAAVAAIFLREAVENAK